MQIRSRTQFLPIVILCLLRISGLAQCPNCRDLIIMEDTSICLGSSAKLKATTNGFVTKWTPSADLSDPLSPSPLASPSATTTYTVEVQYPLNNLFANNNFSNGNSGIISDLTYTAGGPPDDHYTIVKDNVEYYYPIYKTVPDHTSGTGTFMLNRVKTGSEKVVFKHSVIATAGTSYSVSLYLVNLNTNTTPDYNFADISLGFRNGTLIKNISIPGDRNWHKVEFSWTATTNGPSLIELVSFKEPAQSRTRVFGIDDLEVSTLGDAKTDDVIVKVNDCFTLTAKKLGICDGDSIQIEAETNGLFQGWEVSTGGTAGIKTPKSLRTWVKPGSSTSYIASGRIQLGNLITNGDFESGDTGFTSDYTCCLGSGGGHYSIGKDPLVITNGASWTLTKHDHTSGTGNMYLSDGGSDPNKDAYKTTVNVVDGKQYAFSAWFANIHSEFLKPLPDTNQAKTTYLSFYINGELNTAIKLPLDTAWHQYFSTWTATSTGPITIEVRNKETSGVGNDFALDDIVFAPLYTLQKTATVNVSCAVCNKPTAVAITNSSQPIVACENSSITLTGNFRNGGINPAFGGMYYSWYKMGSTPTFTAINPVPNGTSVISVGSSSMTSLTSSASGKYILRVQDGNNASDISCALTDTVTVTVNPLTIITKQLPADTSFCEGNGLNLVVSAKGSGNLTYVWKKGTGTLGTTLRTFTKEASVVTDAGNYTVEVTGSCGTVTSTATEVKINSKPTITLQPDDAQACEGSSKSFTVTATGTAPLTYVWRQGTTVVQGNSVTLSLNNLNPADEGSYTVTVSNACGSITSDAKNLTITTTESPAVTLNADKTVVCTGSTVGLIAGGSGGTSRTYTFKRGETTIGTANQTSNTLTTPSLINSTESFTVEMIANSGCLASGASNTKTSNTVLVQVDDEPSLPNPGNIETICKDTYKLNGTTPATGTLNWSVVPATASITTPTSATSDVTGMITAGDYDFTLTVKNGVCPDKTETVTITRSESLSNPNQVIANNKTICSNSANPLLTGISTLKTNETGEWSTATGETATITTIGQTGNLKIGVNRFVYTISNIGSGCPSDTAVASIYVEKEVDAAAAGPDEPTCASDYSLKAIAITNGKGTWSPATSFSGDRNQANATANLVSSSSNTFTWTVSNGLGAVCPDKTDQVTITQAGAITSATGVSIQSKEICEGDPVPLLNTTMLDPFTVNESGAWSATSPAMITTGGQTSNLSTGDNVFTYKISTIVQGCSPSEGTVIIKVTPKPVAHILTPKEILDPDTGNYIFNQSPLEITATAVTSGYLGSWKVTKTSGTGTSTPPSGAGNSILVGGMGFNDVSQVTWTVSDINSICTPAVATINITRKDANTADVENDTICFSSLGTYVLKGNGLLATEKGTWTVEPVVSGVAVMATDTTGKEAIISGLTIPINAGKTEITFKYTITSSVPGVDPSSDVMKLVVNEPPTGGIIEGNDAVCEGTDTIYKIDPAAISSSLNPVTFSWNAGSAPGALRVGPATGTFTRYKFTNNTAGTVIEDTISMVPSNACGEGKEVKKAVNIRIAPRKFVAAPGNSNANILGLDEFCASETQIGYKVDEIQHNIEGFGYKWYWDEKLIGSKPDTTPIGISRGGNWDSTSNSFHKIKVELTNHCSDTAFRRAGIPIIFMEKPVKLNAPVPVTITLESDKKDDKFCIPQDQVIFSPAVSTTYTGLVADYIFKVDGIIQQGPGSLSTFTVDRNVLSDGAKVIAELSPASNQCISYGPTGTIFSNDVEMDGFLYPDSTIRGADTICEQKAVIKLEVGRSVTKSKGSLNDNGSISWYKDGLLMVPQPATTTTSGSFAINLTNASETGKYSVKVIGSVCAHTSESNDTARVKIFDQPKITVFTNPYSVPYVEGLNAYEMPVFVPPLENDTFTSKYYVPTIWLENPLYPKTVLIPEKEEKTQPYILTLETGKPDDRGMYGGCRAQELIQVIYYLPVNIPNAFTPNGDGLNDTWVITGLGKYPNTKVKVYNRWGNSMFVDNDGYRAVWDGTHNGQSLPTGTYYYIIELKGSPDGTDEYRTGHLTIIK